MGQLLLTALTAKKSLDLDYYRLQEYEDEDGDYALYRTAEEVAADGKVSTRDSCQRRINARCGGLLEIRQGRADFLHQSVQDFLLTREMNDYVLRESEPNFKVNSSILKTYVYSFRKSIYKSTWVPPEEHALWSEGLAYANDALDEDTDTALTLLDGVEDIYREISTYRETFLGRVLSNEHDFHCKMFRAGVDRYVSLKLKEDPAHFDQVSESPLLTAMKTYPWSQGQIGIVRQLLESVTDPNRGRRQTPWAFFLQLTCQSEDAHHFTMALQSSLFSEFIRRGSRVEVKILLNHEVGLPYTRHRMDLGLPITHFLLALFRYDNTHRLPRECIHALEDFADSNIELIPLEIAEGLPLLQHYLNLLADKPLEPGRTRFLAQVIRKLFTKWKPSGSDLTVLTPSILEAFPGATGIMLSNMISSPESTEKYRSHQFQAKRPHGSEEADMCARKRRVHDRGC
ncbi:hypothetical protein F4777DRAFT_469350 [Nemania sp. FL0916]|nr:hypothetical protein F4777DRAFT_469350 [Nemania sp. FL0916]